METTYHIKVGEMDISFLEKIKAVFGVDENVTILVKNEEEPKSNQQEMFRQMEKIRKKYAHIKIDPNLDLSALANEVNL